jgi:hypothetical protein
MPFLLVLLYRCRRYAVITLFTSGIRTNTVPLLGIAQLPFEEIVKRRSEYGNGGQQTNIVPVGCYGRFNNIGA